MYIPMYKNRMYETKFLREYGYLFENNKIMPYIEIIFLKLSRKSYKIEDLMDIYDKHINSKYFLDFFAFDAEEYSQPNLERLKYPYNLRLQDENEYLDLLIKTIKSEKAIPVISIKKARKNFKSEDQLAYVINELQKHKKQIAVRIDGKLYEKYASVLNDELRKNDYLFFDIKEENIGAYILDILPLKENNNFIKILANSPREREKSNGSYKCNTYSDLINNEVRDEYINLGFNGYSDYSGLKDDLPKDGGSSGYGAALALLYDYTNNKYYALTNHETEDGVKGYVNVVNKIETDKNLKKLLRFDKCLAYKYIKDNLIAEGRYGTYATWNFITMIRVLSEMKIFM